MLILREARGRVYGAEQGKIKCKNSYLGGIGERLAGKFQPSRAGVDGDSRVVANLAREQLAAERGFELALDQPLQRTRAV